MFAAGTAEDRLKLPAKRLLAEDLPDRLDGNRASLQVRARQTVLVVVPGQVIEEPIAPLLDLGGHLRGDGCGAKCFALVLGVIVQGLHLEQIDNASERRRAILDRTAADGDGNGDGLTFEAFLDFLEHVGKVGADDVHFVDKDETGYVVLVGLPPDGFRLRLDALLGVEDHDAAVQDAQGAFDLRGEIDVARGIDEVDGAVAPGERDTGAIDGDAAFLLFLVVVGLGRAGIDSAQAIRGAGIIEDMLGGRRLAGIDVRNDAEVADLGQVIASGGHGRIFGVRWLDTATALDVCAPGSVGKNPKRCRATALQVWLRQ